MVTRKRDSSFPCLNSCVLSSYDLSVFTGHNKWFDSNIGKKNSGIGFPCLDCLANVVG